MTNIIRVDWLCTVQNSYNLFSVYKNRLKLVPMQTATITDIKGYFIYKQLALMLMYGNDNLGSPLPRFHQCSKCRFLAMFQSSIFSLVCLRSSWICVMFHIVQSSHPSFPWINSWICHVICHKSKYKNFFYP